MTGPGRLQDSDQDIGNIRCYLKQVALQDSVVIELPIGVLSRLLVFRYECMKDIRIVLTGAVSAFQLRPVHFTDLVSAHI